MSWTRTHYVQQQYCLLMYSFQNKNLGYCFVDGHFSVNKPIRQHCLDLGLMQSKQWLPVPNQWYFNRSEVSNTCQMSEKFNLLLSWSLATTMNHTAQVTDTWYNTRFAIYSIFRANTFVFYIQCDLIGDRAWSAYIRCTLQLENTAVT